MQLEEFWRRGGLQTAVAEKEVRVGMSLVFNAAFRLDEIASVCAGPNDPEIGQDIARLTANYLSTTI